MLPLTQEIGATKPDKRVFKAALATLKQKYDVEQRDILHVAQVQGFRVYKCMSHAHAMVNMGHEPTLAAWGRPGRQEPNRWLCIVQSQYHDIKPAKALGFKTAWIERRHDQLVPIHLSDTHIWNRSSYGFCPAANHSHDLRCHLD